MKSFFVALGAATLMLSASAAGAAPFGPDRVSVATDDLNLDTSAGQALLRTRVADAAAAVCGEGLANIHLLLAAEARACKTEVIAQLAPRLDALGGRHPTVEVQGAMN